MLKFYIPGRPQAKQRARVTKTGHAYTPKETVNYENYVKWCFSKEYPDHTPYEGALGMDIYIDVPVPMSASKKKRAAMLADEIRPTKKPDNSNIQKSVEDSLNKIAYLDDKQIVEGKHSKKYNEREGVLVVIYKV
ncbi:RusA family crossover junction endodeoxyribonuclease [Acidaminobacter sp.]|uniref:RusA family crossover junction endodeoxyribonuclease n=1 Tax=Acidaminobacter sp. TaxID=1872102 RepID=UPI0025C3D8DB|nr:RusA family crossover junction endodeoxyribonuclease [Acidaminobacter sp.]